jgi:hypothetical protein
MTYEKGAPPSTSAKEKEPYSAGGAPEVSTSTTTLGEPAKKRKEGTGVRSQRI